MWFRIDDLVVREWLGIPPHARIKKGGGQGQHSNFFKLHYRITRKYASDHLAVSKPLEKFSVSTQRHEYMFVIYVSDSRMTYPHPLKKKLNLNETYHQSDCKKKMIFGVNQVCAPPLFLNENMTYIGKTYWASAAFWTQFLWLRWQKTGGNEEQFGVMNIGREIGGRDMFRGSRSKAFRSFWVFKERVLKQARHIT